MVAADAIQPLAWELPFAAGSVLKWKAKKPKNFLSKMGGGDYDIYK